MTDTIRIGDSTRDIVYAENTNKLYVCNAGSGDISVIDGSTNEVVDTIDVRGNPFDLEYSAVDGYVYVMNSPYVTALDMESENLVTNYEVDINLREMKVDLSNGNIYSSTLSNYAYVIDRLTSNGDSIGIGSSKYAVEYIYPSILSNISSLILASSGIC